jgi:hypothetical protein
MLNLIVFIFATAGLTWMLTRSKIFKPFREKITHKRNIFNLSVKSTELKSRKNTIKYKLYLFLDEMLGCYGCCGVWSGGIIYLLQKCNIEIVLYVCIGAISSQILVLLVQFLEKK